MMLMCETTHTHALMFPKRCEFIEFLAFERTPQQPLCGNALECCDFGAHRARA